MTNGLTDEAIAAYAADLIEIEAAIEQGQDDKKAVYANLRETYGKRAADSLKLAIKRHRMDADKRTEADEIDAEAERFLEIIRKPSAPRATRSAITMPEHDADGVIIEPEAPTPLPEAPVNPVAHVENARGAKTSEREPSEPEGSGGMQDEETIHPPTIPEPETERPPAVSEAGYRGAVTPPAAATVVPSNVVPIKKRTTLNDPPDPRCQQPELCGGFSNIKLCAKCRGEAVPVHSGSAA